MADISTVEPLSFVSLFKPTTAMRCCVQPVTNLLSKLLVYHRQLLNLGSTPNRSRRFFSIIFHTAAPSFHCSAHSIHSIHYIDTQPPALSNQVIHSSAVQYLKNVWFSLLSYLWRQSAKLMIWVVVLKCSLISTILLSSETVLNSTYTHLPHLLCSGRETSFNENRILVVFFYRVF